MLRPVLLALSLAFAGAPALATSWVIADTALKARPDTHARHRGVAYACERVHVLARRHGWVRIAAADGTGWASSRRVADHRPAHCRRARVEVEIFLNAPHLRHPRIWHPDHWEHHRIRPRHVNPLHPHLLHPWDDPRRW